MRIEMRSLRVGVRRMPPSLASSAVAKSVETMTSISPADIAAAMADDVIRLMRGDFMLSH